MRDIPPFDERLSDIPQDAAAAVRAVGEAIAEVSQPSPAVGKAAKGRIRARPLPVTMFEDLAEEPIAKTWLVESILGAGEIVVVFGAPGDGKSVLVGDLACHVAAGLPWFDRAVKQGGVVYLAAERGKLVKRRMLAWGRRKGIERLPLAIFDGGLDLAGSDADARRIVDTVHDLTGDAAGPLGPSVTMIVVDTKNRTLGGGDENAPKDMSAFVRNCDMVARETGAAIVVIDHSPFGDASRMRGHGALLGAVDATFKVGKSGGHRTFEAIKANDGPDDTRLAFTLESFVLEVDAEGNEMTAPIVVAVDQDEDATRAGLPKARRLSDRQQIAIDALNEALLAKGKPAPVSFSLPFGMKVVAVADWRDEMCARGAIDEEAANPRKAFARIKDALMARRLIGERDNLVWSAGPV